MKKRNKKLTFDKARIQNKKRCELCFHKIEEWSLTDWACALAGEVGELCNFIKKMRRLEKGKTKGKKSYEELRQEAKKEIGDAFAYLDLLSQCMGLCLEDCVRDKFNEVSDRYGVKIKL
jgi:NTP pyrophosphatase (non-canonical NTP hydrolase)